MRQAAKPVFALVDCNNFFVSCERVFRPDLWRKPIAVLSNNDGCIVARSNEVKAMGIPMGVPYFKVRDILKRNNVALFSGNFALYGDFSQRVVQLLQQACPDIEVYSVDESFLEISTLPITDYTAWGRQLRAKVLQYTGIPVSVGIAPTRTLAKAAADYAKKDHTQQGAFAVVDGEQKQEALLRQLPLEDIWGVGRRTAPKLRDRGLQSAYDVTLLRDEQVLRLMTVSGLKMVRELRGQSCRTLTGPDDPQHSIIRSRSFGHTISAYYELEAAVATFAAQAAATLRSRDNIAGSVMVHVYNSRHAPERRGGSYTVRLQQPGNSTSNIITAALTALRHVYDPDVGYKKAGVVLADLRPCTAQQLAFGSDPSNLDRQAVLMRTIDTINRKSGRRLVRHASEQPQRTTWFSRKQLHSPAYTTHWAQLPVVGRADAAL